jgi:hypothetical protein
MKKVTLISILLTFCISISSAFHGNRIKEPEETDFTKPVVLLAPVDRIRVKEIIPMLSPGPKGFGEPCADRKRWERLKATGKFDKLLQEADRMLIQKIPPYDEALYMGFFTKGDSQSGKDLLAKRIRYLVSLVWAECIENQGKYMTGIESTLKDLITQKTWVNPRNYSEKNFDGLVELSTASYAHNIAQTLYLLGDKLSPEIRKASIDALYQRAFNPILRTFETQNKDHGWLVGTNNWNAVCLAGVTGAALTVIENAEERAVFVTIAERYIKNFVAGFLDDGYCTEGLGYFNYGFGNYIVLREKILQATNGKIDLFKDNPRISAIAWFLPNMEIINDVYPAIADCRLNTKPSGSILQYMSKTLGMGLKKYESMSFEGSTQNLVDDIMYIFPNSTVQPGNLKSTVSQQSRLYSYFQNAGVLTVRPEKDHKHALGVNIKGGSNNEHHNHNDLGSFTIVVGNEVMAGDPGSIPYTAKTFSDERYSYKSLGSYGHPVALIAGKEQRTGAEAQAKILGTDFTPNKDIIRMDLSSAYEVPELKKLTREFSYFRSKNEKLQISDEFEFSSPQLFETALITRLKWRQISANQLILEGKNENLQVTVTSPNGGFSIKSEDINEENGIPYTRLGLRLDKPVRSGVFNITFIPLK